MSNVEVGERFADALTSSDKDTLNEICAPDCEFVVPGMSASGVDAMIQYNSAFLSAFPDESHEIVRQIAAEDAVVFEIVYRGTHTGPMQTPQGDIEPTGKKVELPGVMVMEIEDDKVRSFHGYFDQAGMLAQLGLTP